MDSTASSAIVKRNTTDTYNSNITDYYLDISNLASIPEEILYRIFSCLNYHDLGLVSGVCTRLNEKSLNVVLQRDFRWIVNCPKLNNNQENAYLFRLQGENRYLKFQVI